MTRFIPRAEHSGNGGKTKRTAAHSAVKVFYGNTIAPPALADSALIVLSCVLATIGTSLHFKFFFVGFVLACLQVFRAFRLGYFCTGGLRTGTSHSVRRLHWFHAYHVAFASIFRIHVSLLVRYRLSDTTVINTLGVIEALDVIDS